MTIERPRASHPRGSAAVIIIVLLVVAAAAFAIYWFGFRDSAPSAKLAAAHIPAEAEWVGGVQVASLAKSELLKLPALAAAGFDMEQATSALASAGLKLEDIDSLVFGAKGGESGVPNDFIAVGTGRFDASAVRSALAAVGGAEAAVGAKIPFDTKSVEILDPHTVIAGNGELLARAAAVRAGSAPSIADNAALAELRGAIDQGASFWVAGPVPAGQLGGLGGGLGMLGGDMGEPTHFALSANATDQLRVRLAVRFASGDAGAMAKQIDTFLSIGKMMAKGPEGDMLKSISVSGSGQVLSGSLTITKELLAEAASGRGGFSLPF